MKKKITVTSTTGTAPLEFVAGVRPGEIFVFTEDGAGQVYSAAEIYRALNDLTGGANDAAEK